MTGFEVAAFLPEHVARSSHLAREYAMTHGMRLQLMYPCEKEWARRQQYLARQGYRLRPRYQPGWTPSWHGTNVHPAWCEDSIKAKCLFLMDATRVTDGQQIALKVLEDDSNELRVLRRLASDSSDNHCLPIFDILPDPLFATSKLIVTLYLYPFDNPKFETVANVIDFVSQTLQGLRFMHDHGVVHGNCVASNIMMDSRPLYPFGRHPIQDTYALDAMHDAVPLSRQDHSVRYYFVSFGNAVAYADKDEVPVASFAEDVAALGKVYKETLVDKYYALQFLKPLVEAMTEGEPGLRLEASNACSLLEDITLSLSDTARNSTLDASFLNMAQNYLFVWSNGMSYMNWSLPSLW